MIRLKELRQERGLNQQELALKINTTQRNISNWENGNSEPDIQMILKMSRFFGVTVDYFIGCCEEINENENSVFLDKTLINVLKNLTPDKKRALLTLLKDYYI